MSSRYSLRGQVPLNVSSPVRATRAWNPFVPLQATSKPLSGFKTYTVALSLRCGGRALSASWISKSRGNGSRFLGPSPFCALAVIENSRAKITEIVRTFLILAPLSFNCRIECPIISVATSRSYATFVALCGTKAANWRSSALAMPARHPSAIDWDTGSGKMSSSPFSRPSKMPRAADSVETLGMSKPRFMSVSTGAQEDGMDRHALASQKGPQRLRHVGCGRLGNGVAGYDRQGGERCQRQIVDDGSVGAPQQRQESARYFKHSEEVDSQVLLDGVRIDQIIVNSDAGIVNEDVEGADLIDAPLDLRKVRHVQRRWRHTFVRLLQ